MHSSIFKIIQDVLKSANLLHKRGLGDSQSHSIVHLQFFYTLCQDNALRKVPLAIIILIFSWTRIILSRQKDGAIVFFFGVPTTNRATYLDM